MQYSAIGVTLLVLNIQSVSASALRVCIDGTQLNPNDRFSQQILTSDAGDYKVINDAATGLQWSYCLVGQTIDIDKIKCLGQPIVPYDLVPEVKYKPNIRQKVMDSVESENHRLGTKSNPWRLPNVNELLSIYNDKCIPTYYPMFSIEHNTSYQEIEDLLTTEFSWSDSYNEITAAKALIAKGRAYNDIILSTSTAVMDNLFYYSISFNGHGTITSRRPDTSGMLRLVRQQPETE